jgi:monoamine oxidase
VLDALHLVHQFDLSCLNSLWWSTDISIVKKQAISDIGFDQGMKVALKFNSSIPGCGDPWWTTAAGGNVGLFVTNGKSGGYAWPSNYKDGSTDHTLLSFIMGDNAKELSEHEDTNLIVEQILQDLDSMFDNKPASTCFGVIDHNNYVIQNWGESPYTRGAYSFHTPTTGKARLLLVS